MRPQGFEAEVTSGQRFEFGKNWQSFLSVLDEERIATAESSLTSMLGMGRLVERSFLDIGSGSGLFSLAAMRLGAQRVHSFDYDPQSVECSFELKHRFFPEAERWTVERGSVLDADYLSGLGRWDIVYSWGVLPHTGSMWEALQNVTPLVQGGGILFLALYNDQERVSRRWRMVKRLYNTGPWARWLVTATVIPYFVLRGLVADVLHRKNPAARYREYKKSRGMSRLHDWLDWLGGYPFEVARPEEILDFYRERGFSLERLKTCGGGYGNNEFVFKRQ
jgi:2-polyprenyl-3-methyl-5-hydroxy-6-metoxy-1,4-benzoquinol methylase